MELSGNTIPLSRIKPNPENPRVIHDDKFKKLCKSLTDFPQMMEKRPIVVDENWMILGGNMRFRAMKENGLKAIPVEWVSIAEGWTDAQKKEFIIKDNAGFGDWEWNTLANWDVPLADWGVDVPKYDEEPEPDNLDGLPKDNPFVCKITFKDGETMARFVESYKSILEDDYGCIISESGGML